MVILLAPSIDKLRGYSISREYIGQTLNCYDFVGYDSNVPIMY